MTASSKRLRDHWLVSRIISRLRCRLKVMTETEKRLREYLAKIGRLHQTPRVLQQTAEVMRQGSKSKHQRPSLRLGEYPMC
jgi:hypothetical protein